MSAAGFVFTLGELAAALEGQLEGDPAARALAYALDSRAVEPGAVFFALQGNRTDGHLFLRDVQARGAAAAVVRPGTGAVAGLGLIRVDDPVAALGRLGVLFRRRWPLQVVGITGSAGKTTTKEFTASLLATRRRVFKSEGNLNSTVGLPLTLSRRRPEDDLAVLELGMSTPGELRRVAAIARPDVAVITNVGLAHAMNFATPDGIAREKESILESLAADGVFVAGSDDARVREMRARFAGRSLGFGLEAGAELRGFDLEPLDGGGTRFRYSFAGGEARAELRVAGAHQVRNALAALAVAAALGLDPLALAPAVAALAAAPHRGGIVKLTGGVTLLDDCYNSNPAALAAALATLAALPGKRHVAVLGDMRELGAGSREEHRAAGALAARAAALVVAVGAESLALAEAARAAGAEVHHFGDASLAAAALPGLIHAGDAVLVKASRGIGLEAAVEALLRERG